MADLEKLANDKWRAGVSRAALAGVGAHSDVQLRPLALRLDAAVRLSGLSRSEIYRRAREGELPLLKIGNRTLVRVADLERILDSLPHLHPASARSPEAEKA